MLPWRQALGGRYLRTVSMNSHNRENPTGFSLKSGTPKGLRDHSRQPTGHNSEHHRTLMSLFSHACNPCWLALRAKAGTGWLCRTELRAAPQTLICIARSTALGKKKISW